ncbi:MAG: EcsC family protein [Synechococcales bacterium]|nr:EcsC family protein [Synechococcales bacterium]
MNQPKYPPTAQQDSPSAFDQTTEKSTQKDPIAQVSESVTAAAGHVSKTLTSVTEVMTDLSESSTTALHRFLEEATQQVGGIATFITDNSMFKALTRLPFADRLPLLLGKVDTEKAAKEVNDLRRQYPVESADQLAHRIIVDTATKAGTIGLVTNLVPPLALTLFAVDLAAITALQAEMIHRIAAAYGFSLDDPARRGEVLTIYGLSLGGSGVLKTGLSFVELIPGIGAVVGATSNAAVVYSLGFVACRYYEAKRQSADGKVDTEALKAESADSMQDAIAQQSVMDQIIAHMVLISYPDRARDEILPELERLSLTHSAHEAVAQHLDAPRPLESLLDELHPGLAAPVAVQCCRIAKQDGVVTPAERTILDAIAKRFNLNLTELEASC